MAKKKSRQSRISNGSRQKANKAHEEKRQAKFAAKRENGTAYEYKPNPYKKGTPEWAEEEYQRSEKNKSSKLPYARMQSIMAKLKNQLVKEELAQKEKESKRKNK